MDKRLRSFYLLISIQESFRLLSKLASVQKAVVLRAGDNKGLPHLFWSSWTRELLNPQLPNPGLSICDLMSFKSGTFEVV